MVNVALVKAATHRVVNLLLAPTCVLCGAAANDFDLCTQCRRDFAPNAPSCMCCAEPLASNELVCGQCLQKPPRYHNAQCAYRYEYPVDHLIRALKFGGRLACARVLGELLAEHLRMLDRPLPEIVIPVPLAAGRFRERGFNQALEIGRVLAARLSIPLRADLLVRTRNTREQTGLDKKERRKNLRGAFALSGKLPVKRIAIVDDVITTGSTMNEIASMLRRAGAAHIEAWAVARTAKR